jgi:hypothetical protein
MPKPVAMTTVRMAATGKRRATRAPMKPPSVAHAIIHTPRVQTIAPAHANASTESNDNTSEVAFLSALAL